MPYSISKLKSDENGSVIIAALLILVTLTIMGIWAMNTTVTEYEIANNDQLHKIAFTNADSGVYATPKLISKTINESASQDATSFGFEFVDTTSGAEAALYSQILGYASWDGGATDISMTNSVYGDTVEVDIERVGQENVEGGGVEFGAGAEGIGVGSSGGVRIVYTLDSFGAGPRNSASNVRADYRKVVGVAGGL